MSTVDEVIYDFICNYEQWWSGNARQSEKANKRISRLQKHYHLSSESLAKIVCAVARQRISNNIPTVYLPSFGSSGSHLFQHILVQSFNLIGLNEVYIAPYFERILKQNAENRTFRYLALEAYHVLHASQYSIFKMTEIVNTAHKPDLHIFADNTCRFKAGLIKRFPPDVVISRTYRKQDYRSYLAKDTVPDEMYLKENIEKAKSFYDRAFKFKFDEVFSYEELIDNPGAAKKRMEAFMQRKSHVGDIESIIRSSIQRGATNMYQGPEIKIPAEAKRMAEEELYEYAQRLGYPGDGQSTDSIFKT